MTRYLSKPIYPIFVVAFLALFAFYAMEHTHAVGVRNKDGSVTFYEKAAIRSQLWDWMR